MGQSSPNYGLMVDDHTAFIKSGNRTALYGLNHNLDRGFRDIFNPESKKPLIFEWGMNLPNGLLMTVDLFQDIDNQYSRLVNYAATLNYIKDFNNGSLMFGSSLMDQQDISLCGIFGGFSISNVTMTFEIDKAENLFTIGEDEEAYSTTSIASYAQFVYKPIQGLHLISKYDYFDFDYDFKTGAIGRYTFGIELYPLNILEIKAQTRKYEVINAPDNFPDLVSEYLIQIHTWF